MNSYIFFVRLGMALAPWNVLAGGKLRTDEEEKRRMETGEKGRVVNIFLQIGFVTKMNEKSAVFSKKSQRWSAQSILLQVSLRLACFFFSMLNHLILSGYCILNAESSICLSYCRWTQSRTFTFQPGSSRYFTR